MAIRVPSDWYENLITDCKQIIEGTEKLISRALVVGYHALGNRILNDYNNFERKEIYGGEIASRVSQSLGKSKRTIERAIQFAKKYPSFQDVPKDVSWHQICNEYLPSSSLASTPIAFASGIYRTIVIDPPWEVNKIARRVRPNQHEWDYPSMSIEEIKSLPVGNLMDNKLGAHIYLWTTHKYLPYCFDIFVSWGIHYQCMLTWVKNVGITPYSWMYSTEHILFGKVGDLELLQLGKRLDFSAKVREHSRKPDEFYELVKTVSPEPRIDIFAREARDGFDTWGNETTKFLP